MNKNFFFHALIFMKDKIKKTKLGFIISYLKYLISRFVISQKYKSYYTYKSILVSKIHVENSNFFGYYNITPNNNNDEIIFLSVRNQFKRGSLIESAKIMLKIKNSKPFQISQTHSWNWQQGCMLQWLGKKGDLIIFNDYDNASNKYYSKIINTKGDLIRKFEMPINNVNKKGDFALCLNYERLAIYRPDYGYFNKKESKLLKDEDDGIWSLNLLTGEIKLIISIEKLKDLKYSETMNEAIHKVNHLEINPIGNRFIFLHRWIGPKGRYTRLISANIDGTEIFILNGDKMTSHCCWINESEIISFCFIENYGNAYYRFIDKSHIVNKISDNLPLIDGHPSVSNDNQWMIIDTYPDKSRMSNLYLYNFLNDRIIKIGEFYQPLKYDGELRIDLHPKWDYNSKNVFFESGHEKNRNLFRINLSEIL
jgi:hypothetical protein